MLTFLDVQRFIRHTLGGEEPSSDYSAMRLANEAGEELVNARAWNFLIQPEVLLNLTAGQTYIDLPEDFGQVVSLQTSDSLNGSMAKSTLPEVARWRSSPVPSGPTTYFWAIEYSDARARIALHKEPSVSIASGVRLVYRASWARFAADSDAAKIPPWCEGLYLEFVRCVVLGRFEEDMMTLPERVERLVESSYFRRIAARDGTTQVNTGQMRGGAAHTLMRGKLFNPDTAVGSPVQY